MSYTPSHRLIAASTRSFRLGAGLGALAIAVVTVGVGSAAHAPDARAATPTVAMTVSDSPYTDNTGTTWSAQSGFNGLRLSTPVPARTIRGSNDPGLYRTGNWQMTSWRTSLPNGDYFVTLKMADTWFASPGMRTFNVTSQGTTVLRDVDIVAAVGQNAEYDRSFNAPVRNGTLTLGWQAISSWPTVSAITVRPIGSPAVPPTTPPAPPTSTTGPNASNTGVPAGTTLSRRDGMVLLTTPGGVYSNLDIHGRVRVMAPNITLKNSIVRGDASSTFGSLVDANYPGANHTNFTLMDSELVPEYPSYFQDGILGHDYTVIRANIHGSVDAVKIVGNNVKVQNSWLHDTTFVNAPTGPTHNDGVQVLVGSNILIQGNRIERNDNSGMQVTQDRGAVTGLQFLNNWGDGGGCTVNLAHKPLPTMSGITVSGNRFERHTRVANCAIVSGPSTALTASGNTWVDNGQPVAITRGM